MPSVATRVASMSQSVIRSMTQRCRAAGGVNIGQGLCLVEPPAGLLEAAAGDFADVSHSYSPAEGNPGLLEDLSRKLRRDNGINADPARQIVVTVGATGALNATLLALLRPGDGVLLLEPFYGYHLTSVLLADLVPQPVRLIGPGFLLDPSALAAAVRPDTRALIVCTPANPSGHRMTRAELAAIAEVAERHDLLVITDEIYEYIYYGAEPHLSPTTVDGLADRTMTITGFSKSYSIPGWRLGYVTGPAELIAGVRVVADATSVCAPTPLQELARHALALPDSYYRDLRQMYDRKRQRLSAGFMAAGLPVSAPEGAYYLFVDCSLLGFSDGWSASDSLLTEAGVAVIPAEAFYLDPPDNPYVRACFSLPDRALDEAADRLLRVSDRRPRIPERY